MARIFLSHSSRNNAQAKALGDWLAVNGWSREDVFLDIEPIGGIQPGERWKQALNEAANRCEAVIFLISPEWLASRWCLEELSLAHKLNKRLFGVQIGSVKLDDVPDRLRDEWQLIDLEGPRDGQRFDVEMPDGQRDFATFSRSGLNRLRNGLVKAGLDPRYFDWPPAHDLGRAPYRGLAPMEAEDAGIFYGREAATIAALDQLRGLAEAAPPRLMPVLGASGAGKSSFMRAGLIPRLKRDDRSFLVLPILRPERAAVSGKAGLIASIEGAAQSFGLKWTRSRITKAATGSVGEVAELLSLLASAATLQLAGSGAAAAPTLILPIDQAEELFVAEGREEAQCLLDLLAALLRLEQPKLVALVTIRTDSYEKLQLDPALTDVRQAPFNLPALARGSYQRVIEGPVERLAGTSRALKVEPALTSALLADIEQGGAKDALPLLAFTLERLFADHGSDGDLTLAEYEESNRIAGAIEAAVERALAAAANDARVPKDRAARLALLRRAMIPWLAGIDPETRTARRQVARFNDIPDEARPLVEHFIEQRLLATDMSPTGERTVEPAHEALLRQWGLIDGWLKEDIAVLATLEGVRRAARDWDANARDPNWLAHSGGRREDAEAIKGRVDLVRRLDATDLAYLDAARTAETARRDRELGEARRLADEQRKVATRTRIGAIAATVLAIVAAGAAGYGFWQARIAREQTSIAREQTLIAVQKSEEADNNTRLAEAQRQDADAQRKEAEVQRKQAEETRAAAQSSQSLFLNKLATQQVNEGSTAIGIRVILEALPTTLSQPDRPFIRQVWNNLHSILDRAGTALTLVGHTRPIRFLEFSPDGGRLATASVDGTVRLWDTRTGLEVGLLKGHLDVVNETAFSPDSRLLVSVGGISAFVWNGQTGELIRELKGHTRPIQHIRFFADGQRVATAAWDDTVRIWNVGTGELLKVLSGPVATKGEFSPNANDLIVSSMMQMSATIFGTMGQLALSPDGRTIATGGYVDEEGAARLWDVETGRQRALLRVDGDEPAMGFQFRGIAFSSDGAILATASEDKIRIWQVSDGTPLKEIREKLAQTDGEAMRFVPSTHLLVTGGDDRIARIWDADSGGLSVTMRGHTEAIEQVEVSGDGALVATVSQDQSIRIWRRSDGTGVAVLAKHLGLMRVAFSPDAETLATGGRDNLVRLWKLGFGKPRRSVEALDSERAEEPADASAQNPGEAARTGLLTYLQKRAFDTEAAREVPVNAVGTAGALLMMEPPQVGDSELTTGPWMTVVEATTGKLLTSFAMRDDEGRDVRDWSDKLREVDAIRISADQRLAFSAHNDFSIRVWDLSTGQPDDSLTLQLSDVCTALTLSPDSRLLVAGALDGSVRVRSAASPGQPKLLKIGTVAILDALADPAGTRILARLANGSAQLWDIDTPRRIAEYSGSIRADSWRDNTGSVAFDPVLPRAAIVVDGGIALIDTQTGERLWTVGLADESEHTLKFSGDGTRLYVATEYGTEQLIIFDTKLGERVQFDQLSNPIAVSDDGSRVLGRASSFWGVWDVTSGKLGARIESHEWEAPHFSAGGRIVETLSSGVRRLWRAEDGTAIATLQWTSEFDSSMFDQFSPNGQLLAWSERQPFAGSLTNSLTKRPVLEPAETAEEPAWDDVSKVKILSTRTGQVVATFHPEGEPVRMFFSPDNARLATIDESSRLAWWDAHTGSQIGGGEQLEDELASEDWIAWTPTGPRLIERDYQPVRVVDLTTGATLGSLNIGEGLSRPSDYSLSDSSSLVALDDRLGAKAILAGWGDGTPELWDARTGTMLFRLEGHLRPVVDLGISSPGKNAFTLSTDGRLILWNTDTGQPISKWGDQGFFVLDGLLDPTGQRLAIVAGTRPDTSGNFAGFEMMIADAQSGATILEPVLLKGSAIIDVATDGRWFSVVSGGKVLVLSAADGSVVRDIAGSVAAFGYGGRYFGAAEERELKAINLEGEREATWTFEAKVAALAISNDGHYWAIALEDGNIEIRDAETGTALQVVSTGLSAISGLQFSVDGRSLIAISPSGADIFDLGPNGFPGIAGDQQLIDLANLRAPQSLTVGEREAFFLTDSEAPRGLATWLVPLRKDGQPATDCDRMAADPEDPDFLGGGVPLAQVRADEALAACETAIAASPAIQRFIYQRARALHAAGRLDEARSDYFAAATAGYAPAAVAAFLDPPVTEEFRAPARAPLLKMLDAAAVAGNPKALELVANGTTSVSEGSKAARDTTLRRAADAGSAWAHVEGLTAEALSSFDPRWDEALMHTLIGYRLAAAVRNEDLQQVALGRLAFFARQVPADLAVDIVAKARAWTPGAPQ